MNDIDSLQMNIESRDGDTLLITFKGESSMEDVDMFKNAIDARIKQPTRFKKVVFDLAQIHPIHNAAGRLLDLACLYQKTRKIPIEFHMPERIYALLQEITPKEMPEPPVARTRARDIDIVVVPQPMADSMQEISPMRLKELDEVLRKPKTVLACVGKVRNMKDSKVTVSLFTDPGEIIGEFDISQFPKQEIVQGMVFDYRVQVLSPGRTEVSIELYSEQQPSDENMMDMAKELRKVVHFEDV